MNYPLALICAALTVSIATPSSAGEMPLPERKPVMVQHAVADTKSLEQAKYLLEQISYELKKPATQENQQYGLYASYAPMQQTQITEPVSAEAIEQTPTVEDLENLSISQPGDLEMMCGDLSKESMNMRDIIYATQDVKDRAKMRSHGIKAAGAVGSFLVGTVTGGVGLALGGFLLDQNVGATASDADEIQDIAEQRRTLMMGIYNAKGCEGPLEHAMQNPEIFDPLGKLASIETAAGQEHAEPQRTRGFND